MKLASECFSGAIFGKLQNIIEEAKMSITPSKCDDENAIQPQKNCLWNKRQKQAPPN